jgi:hypothetical protein
MYKLQSYEIKVILNKIDTKVKHTSLLLLTKKWLNMIRYILILTHLLFLRVLATATLLIYKFNLQD